jgi:hypothetical protein
MWSDAVTGLCGRRDGAPRAQINGAGTDAGQRPALWQDEQFASIR